MILPLMQRSPMPICALQGCKAGDGIVKKSAAIK
jgi:hypothetical protein